MSGALRAVGQIAGVVAAVAMFIPGGQGVASIAAAVSTVASIGAQITAKKPPAQGSSNQITIGANMPSPMILGESYYGGNRVHQVGYGTENDVPNAYLLPVDIFGVGGPYEALVGTYGDFTEISFDGSGKAIGFYSNNTLYRDDQLGTTPEATALAPHWAGAPDWGSAYKLSGKAAIAWNARFPKDGKRYGSGFFQSGAVWRGIKLYDPRLDSTYPGGSGAQRWDDPTDLSGFSAAKATWTYSRNPGLHALRYALGTWERDETDIDAPYVKVFGIGLGLDGIVIEDFVELANVCDDNGWTCNGVIEEPGDKWANLKSILQAGGAEPCFKGGKLGVRINAPRVALDTITRDDLADGELSIPAMLSYRDRLNIVIPKYRSPAHKWEYVATQEVVSTAAFVTQDGEKKPGERQYNLVTNPVQAAQLAGYDLYNGREAGPIELPCKPRLRRYAPGDLLTLDLPEAGLEGDYVILQRSIDPMTMTVNLTFVSENPDKHAFALAQTGTAPPPITITSPETRDDVAGSNNQGEALFLFNGGLSAGATLQRNSYATYFSSTGVIATAGPGIARFDHVPTSPFAARGLLVEDAATNLIPSGTDTTAWVNISGVTKTDGQADPAGGTAAALITATGASFHLVGSQNAAVTNAQVYTGSFFVKPGTATRVQAYFRASGFDATHYANFQLTGAGSVTAVNGCTAAIEQLANGWYRISITHVANATVTDTRMTAVFINSGTAGRNPSYASTDTLTLYGFQIEAGARATSHIPTPTAVTVERTADVVTLDWTTRLVPDGTIVVRYTFDDGSTQDVSTTIAVGTSTIPTDLNRPWIVSALRV